MLDRRMWVSREVKRNSFLSRLLVAKFISYQNADNFLVISSIIYFNNKNIQYNFCKFAKNFSRLNYEYERLNYN